MTISHSSEPLADALAALGTRGIRGTRLEASGEWALSFQGRGRLKFVFILRGRCSVILPDAEPEVVSRGDVFLLSDTPFTVASDPGVEPVDGMSLFEPPGRDAVRVGARADTVMIGGGSAFTGGAAFAPDALPPFLRLGKASPAAVAVARTLDMLGAEVAGGRPGASCAIERLAEVLLLEALRAHAGAGRIGALGDRRIAAALRSMHGDPARAWTLAALAASAGMSRSAFASRFAARVGRPPLDYLRDRRMAVARRMLQDGDASVAEVAWAVGYGSPSAFSHAFRRMFGAPPRSLDGTVRRR